MLVSWILYALYVPWPEKKQYFENESILLVSYKLLSWYKKIIHSYKIENFLKIILTFNKWKETNKIRDLEK